MAIREIVKSLKHKGFTDFDITQHVPNDPLGTLAEISQIPSDRIDRIDLNTCSDILAHFVAQDGQLIYEREPDEFERFRQKSLKAPAELKQFRQTQRDKVFQALER